MPDDLKSLDKRMAVLSAIKEVQRRCDNKLPLIDPEKDMKINTPQFKEIVKKIKTFEKRLQKHSLHNSEDLPRLMQEYRAKSAVMSDLTAAKHHLRKSKSLLQMDELKCMKRVLRRLGYCSASDVIEIKGRIACELSSADELLLTELMFNGVFNPLNAPQVFLVLVGRAPSVSSLCQISFGLANDVASYFAWPYCEPFSSCLYNSMKLNLKLKLAID